MNRTLNKVRAGRATDWGASNLTRTVDKLYFRLLGVVHRWTIRQAVAHCQREKQRRFRRLMSWQNHHLN